MLRITTESGAVYLIDVNSNRAILLEGPEVLNRTWDDNEWVNRSVVYPLEIGLPMVLESGLGETARRRITTPVTRIEESEWTNQKSTS